MSQEATLSSTPQELSDEGMSTRAIAPIVGVSKSQVASDIEVSSSGHLAPQPVSESAPRTEFHDETAGLHVVDDTDDVEGFIETVDTHIAQSDGDLLRGDDWQASGARRFHVTGSA